MTRLPVTSSRRITELLPVGSPEEGPKRLRERNREVTLEHSEGGFFARLRNIVVPKRRFLRIDSKSLKTNGLQAHFGSVRRTAKLDLL